MYREEIWGQEGWATPTTYAVVSSVVLNNPPTMADFVGGVKFDNYFAQFLVQ